MIGNALPLVEDDTAALRFMVSLRDDLCSASKNQQAIPHRAGRMAFRKTHVTACQVR